MDTTRYWGETDWHSNGLPTPQEQAAENKRLSLLAAFMLERVEPRIKLN